MLEYQKTKKLKNIIFDFDGVIYQSQNYHLNKLNEVFDLGFTQEEYFSSHHGNTNREMKKREKFNKIDWDIYHQEIEKDFPLKKIKPEIKKVLENFSKKYNLFIISSGHNQHIIDFLKNNGVWNLFQKTLFLEDHKLKGPKFKMLEEEFNISPQDTLFITDSTGDIVEAREVGYTSIGIDTGVHKENELKKLNPEMIVHSFKELENYIKIKIKSEIYDELKIEKKKKFHHLCWKFIFLC